MPEPFHNHMGPPIDRDNIYTALMKALDSGQEIGLQSINEII